VTDDLGRIEAFLRWAWETSSTRIEASGFGTALFNDRFPSYWDGTLLRVERSSGTGTGAAELIAEADRMFSGFMHREIVVFDDAAGGRLAPAFRPAGWEVDRLVFMAARRAADRASTMTVDKVDFDDVAPLLVETNLHGHGGMTAAAAESNAAVREMLVDIIERFRGRGIARALVGRAVREGRDAGAELVFLIADDVDWPKQLYAKLGFDPVGRYWQFTRPPAGESYR
jgi:GNAT superfamily N-acetyltransferase